MRGRIDTRGLGSAPPTTAQTTPISTQRQRDNKAANNKCSRRAQKLCLEQVGGGGYCGCVPGGTWLQKGARLTDLPLAPRERANSEQARLPAGESRVVLWVAGARAPINYRLQQAGARTRRSAARHTNNMREMASRARSCTGEGFCFVFPSGSYFAIRSKTSTLPGDALGKSESSSLFSSLRSIYFFVCLKSHFFLYTLLLHYS
jgi:hypothetical protein